MKNMTIPFRWTGDEDNVRCKYGNYVLTVDYKPPLMYQWEVTSSDKVIASGESISMPEAMLTAEQIVREL